jgi:tRNA (adenine22-N1)-methyltransferase
MGADTMMSIIHNASGWLKDPKYRLVLQCQSKRPELRQWLYDEGFRINRETLAKDGKFVYSIMEVIYDPGHGISPAETYITRQLLEDHHPLLPEYYERVKSGVELTIFGLKRAEDNRLPIYENILTDLTAMEEQIYGNRS